MRILFYLPVITPWWFDNIVVKLIDKIADEVEVHVLVPPLWCNTGVGSDQLRGCAAMANVRWHIVDDESHTSLRTSPVDAEGLLDFVRSIDPDYTICRSADLTTPSRFPGKVLHLMEGGAPPASLPSYWVVLQDDAWRHGAMPALSEQERRRLRDAFANRWEDLQARAEQDFPALSLPREEALGRLGLPADRKVLALPLEYAHEENFHAVHHAFRDNVDLIEHIAASAGEEFVLAITDHPLNHKYVENEAVAAAIAALPGRAYLLDNSDENGATTTCLMRHCDGLIVQNSKSIYAAAFFGKPLLRLSKRPTAPWMHVHEDVDQFLHGVRTGGAHGPSRLDVETWFAFHCLHEVFDPKVIGCEDFLDRLRNPYLGGRIAAGLDQWDNAQLAA